MLFHIQAPQININATSKCLTDKKNRLKLKHACSMDLYFNKRYAHTNLLFQTKHDKLKDDKFRNEKIQLKQLNSLLESIS